MDLTVLTCLVYLGVSVLLTVWVARLRATGSVGSARGVSSALSVDVGTVLLVLGAMHLGNVFVLNRLCRRAVDGPPAPRQRGIPYGPAAY